MKLAGKLLIVFLLGALILMPFQSAQAKGLLDGQVIFGNSYTVKSGETLNGDLVVFGGSATVEDGGKVIGAVILMGGSVTINGEVTKDVVVIGGAANLGKTAHVYGNFVTMGAPIQREEGARVDGDLIENATPPVNIDPATSNPTTPSIPAPVQSNSDWFTNPLWNLISLFGQSFALAMLALLIALFLPSQTRRVGEAIAAQPVVTGGLGLLTVMVFPLALIAMIITLILIPVAALVVLLFGVAMVFGWLGLGTEIGLRFVNMVPRGEGVPLPMAAAIGTFILSIVANGIGFIPCVGWMAPFILSMLGLGGVLITRFGGRPAGLTAIPAQGPSDPPEERQIA